MFTSNLKNGTSAGILHSGAIEEKKDYRSVTKEVVQTKGTKGRIKEKEGKMKQCTADGEKYM